MQTTGAWHVLVTVNVTVAVPPLAFGAPGLLFVSTALQPPVVVTVANQAAYFVLMAACVWQADSVTFTAQFNTTGGAAVTVNVRVQVRSGWQSLSTVKVTEVVPPQASGAPVLLFVKTALQPPVMETVASHAAYFASMEACVWQAASVVLIGQVRSTAGAAVTVNVRVQVTGTWQALVTVNVTVELPPQALGAPGLLFVSVILQPPEATAEASHVAYLASMAACV